MYYTLNALVKAEQKISRSQFLVFLYPVPQLDNIKEILSEHNREYANATHNCYAYILGDKQQTRYYSDAGEPSGTAGKPILNALIRANLTHVLAIVTRYYGGIKLGVKGLIDAYGGSVEMALADAELVEYRDLDYILLQIDYPILESIKHTCLEHNMPVEVLAWESRILLQIGFTKDQRQNIDSIVETYMHLGKLKFIENK